MKSFFSYSPTHCLIYFFFLALYFDAINTWINYTLLSCYLNQVCVSEPIGLVSWAIELLVYNERIIHLAKPAKCGDATVVGTQIRCNQSLITILHLLEKCETSSQITPTIKRVDTHIVTPCVKREPSLRATNKWLKNFKVFYFNNYRKPIRF